MKKYQRIAACFLMLIPFLESQSQPNDNSAALEEFIIQTMEENNIIGSAITYFNETGDLLTKGYGVTERSGAKVDANTIFELASITKSFTAFAIFQLEEAGKLSIEDHVIDHLPDFRTKNKEVSDQLTLIHLLNHNSGFTYLQGNRTQILDYDGQDALDVAVRGYSNVTLDHMPGEHFDYSSANYQILGLIIERRSGMSYEDYISTHILNALEMNTFSFQPGANIAVSHRQFLGQSFSYDGRLTRNIVAQGGLHGSALDLQKYLKAVMARDTALVSKKSYEKIFESEYVGQSPVGFAGWMKRTQSIDGKEIVSFQHGGTNVGASSMMAFVPELKTGVAILSNTFTIFSLKNCLEIQNGPLPIAFTGRQPPATSSALKIIYLVLWIILLFLLWRVYLRIRKPKKKSIIWTVLSVILALIVSYIAIKFIPNFFGADFPTALRFEPDIAFVLLSVSVLSVSLAVINVINYKRAIANNDYK